MSKDENLHFKIDWAGKKPSLTSSIASTIQTDANIQSKLKDIINVEIHKAPDDACLPGIENPYFVILNEYEKPKPLSEWEKMKNRSRIYLSEEKHEKADELNKIQFDFEKRLGDIIVHSLDYPRKLEDGSIIYPTYQIPTMIHEVSLNEIWKCITNAISYDEKNKCGFGAENWKHLNTGILTVGDKRFHAFQLEYLNQKKIITCFPAWNCEDGKQILFGINSLNKITCISPY
jgi:hypothetical protein